MIYGYCRISRPTQKIQRQITNITAKYPNVKIIEEIYTGTKTIGRKKFNELVGEWSLNEKGEAVLTGGKVMPGDTIAFDSVSRMSRDAVDGFALYQALFDMGVDLVFLKEKHINTAVYKKALSDEKIPMTGTHADYILKGVNEFLMALAQEQIIIAFEQSEKEVKDLQERTKEGLKEAKRHKKRIGTQSGDTFITKKSIEAKKIIMKHSRDFGGNLNDKEVLKLCDISRNTYYRYKKELLNEV